MSSMGCCRLDPKDPNLKGAEDCCDAAEWLIENAQQQFVVELQLVGGEVGCSECANVPDVALMTDIFESANGHFSMLTYVHLAQSRLSFHISGLVLKYGVLDLKFLPQVHLLRKRDTLILEKELIDHCRDAFCPGMF